MKSEYNVEKDEDTKPTVVYVRDDIDWPGIIISIGITVIITLCAGTPDLLDAIIAWVGRQ